MGVLQLKSNIYYVGVSDPLLRVFDIIMSTEFGTTYNAYLVKGEKTALIETVHNRFADFYLNNIESVQKIKDIDYIILNHTEPDHSGSLVKILDINPDIVVYGTNAAIKNIREITNRAFNEHIIKDGEVLDLGNNMLLKFIVAPNLHWPDTMFTYIESSKTLFSCDFLGAHYCEMSITDETIMNKDKYDSAFENYYECIFSPFNSFVAKGLKKLEGLDIDMVCTSHGPVLKDFIDENIKKYAEWSSVKERTEKSAAIYYVSAYGYTKKMAEAFADELRDKDVKVEIFNVIEDDKDQIIQSLHSCDALLFGSPTINRNALKPIWDVISSLDMISGRNKPCAVFGSYGWSGEACKLLVSHLTDLGLKVVDEPIATVFNPSDDDFDKIKCVANKIVEIINK